MTEKQCLDIDDFLTNEFECRDIFLYPGYNCGQPCPVCKGHPNIEPEDPSRCNCYNEALERFKKESSRR